jgi:integrase
MTSRLAEILSQQIKFTDINQPWLFPAEKSATGHTMNIEKAFRRVVKAAGLDPTQVVRHTLRHTAITHLVQAGIDLPTVKRISGHKTLQMVERYSHQNGAHIQAAMDKLEQRYRQL